MDNIYAGCNEPGDVYLEGHHKRCDDGRTLYWTHVNWGWLGEPAQGRTDLDREDPPAAALADCDGA
jgi:hypothetical protein